jgi:tetratricopeptide (TPR) repeat protein
MKKNDQKNQTSHSRWNQFQKLPLTYLFYIILAFVVFGKSTQFFLGKLDEDLLIINQLSFLSNFNNILQTFSRDAFLNETGIFYRPLQTISYMFDVRFFSERGSIFFITNIILHILVCSLLYFLLILLDFNKLSSKILTSFYLVSPLFVHSVAWAPARGDLLIGLTGILSFIFFIKFLRTNNDKFFVGLLLSFTAAIFSKETALVIPVVLLVWYFLFERESTKVTRLKFGMLSIGTATITIIYLFLRSQVVKTPAGLFNIDFYAIIRNLLTFPEFIAKFLLPLNLSPMPGFALMVSILGIFLMIVFLLIIIKLPPKQKKLSFFGLFWFILFTAPGALYIHPLNFGFDYLEHRAYLPLIGIIIMLAAFLDWASTINNRIYFNSATAALVFIFGIYSFFYLEHYREPVAFYDRVLKTNPSCAIAYFAKGSYFTKTEEHDKAIENYDMALRLLPDYAVAYLNKGISLYMMNDKPGSILQYDKAIKYDRNLPQAHFVRGVAYNDLGNTENALNDFNLAIKLLPSYEACYFERGLLHFKLGRIDLALSDFSQVIRINANNDKAYLIRGKIYSKVNNQKSACSDWQNSAILGNNEAQQLFEKYCR